MKQIPLQKKAKVPLHKDWPNREYSAEYIEKWRGEGGNVGLRLEPIDLVIDIDTKHADAKGASAADLEMDLELEFGIDLSSYPRVQTGSGGAHIYVQKPADLKIREKLRDTFGGAVEFKTFGRQVLAPGCIHPNGNPYLVTRKGKPHLAPDALLKALERPVPVPREGPCEAEPDELAALLAQLDPTNFSDYDAWRNMMFACHDATGGSEDGKEVFKAWSLRDTSFPEAADSVDYFWDACLGSDEGRTLATIYYEVVEAGGEIPRPDPCDEFADVLAETTPEEVKRSEFAPRWRTDKGGKIKANLRHNVVEAMKVFGHEFAMDDFAHQIVEKDTGRMLSDDDLEQVSCDISARYGTRWTGDPSRETLQSAATWLALQNRFHPVRDYLNSLEYDGTPRLDSWLIEATEAKDTPYVRAVSRLMLVAAVARAFKPGTKFDVMVIFEGEQGGEKSSLIRHLGGRWALEGLPPLRSSNDKDVVDAMQGFWLIEIEELAATRKTDADAMKAFLSRTADRVRLAYKRNSETFPRQCILIGTTNDALYLRDQTGNRRMAPVHVGRVNLKAVPRDQLWAEALQVWKAWKGPLMLPPALWADAAREQDERLIQDPWEEIFAELCYAKYVGQGFVPAALLLTEGVHIIPEDQTQAHTKRLSQVMLRLRLKKGRQRYGDQRNPRNGYFMPKEQ